MNTGVWNILWSWLKSRRHYVMHISPSASSYDVTGCIWHPHFWLDWVDQENTVIRSPTAEHVCALWTWYQLSNLCWKFNCRKDFQKTMYMQISSARERNLVCLLCWIFQVLEDGKCKLSFVFHSSACLLINRILFIGMQYILLLKYGEYTLFCSSSITDT